MGRQAARPRRYSADPVRFALPFWSRHVFGRAFWRTLACFAVITSVLHIDCTNERPRDDLLVDGYVDKRSYDIGDVVHFHLSGTENVAAHLSLRDVNDSVVALIHVDLSRQE